MASSVMKVGLKRVLGLFSRGGFLRKEWFLLLMLIVIMSLVLYPREKIFTIDVSTEVVSFSISDPKYSEWNIGGASIQKDFFEETGKKDVLPESSRLEPSKGVDVQLHRHGTAPIYITLTCDAGSVGRIDTGDGEYIELGEWALISIMGDVKPEVFSFRGTLDIGDDVTVGIDSILLGGSISIVEEKLLTNGHYIAGQETLNPGDRVQLWKSHEPASNLIDRGSCISSKTLNVAKKKREKSDVDGFIRTEPANNYSEPVNALNLVAHGKADYAEVNRFGSAGYEIKVLPLTRFVNDPILGILLGAVTALLLLLELVSKIRSFNDSKNKGNDTND